MAESRQQLIAGNFEAAIPNAVQLDLREDLGFPLNIKVTEIRDIKRRQGAHSPKSIKLPSTEINNRFFGGLYDIGADFEIFDPNKKVDCRFILDGEEIINGYLQLKSIDTNAKGDTSYNITVFDQVSTFYRQIKDKRVSDIDFSFLDHPLNLTSLQTSWSSDWETFGVFYPLLKDADPNGIRKIEKFKPAVYEKVFLNQIVKQAHPNYPLQEYTWSGSLKDDPIFEREIIPFSGNKPTISEAEAESKAMFVGRDSEVIFADLNPVPSNGFIFAFLTATPLPFNDETTPPFDDSNNLFASNIFTAPTNGLYKFDCNLGIRAVCNYTTFDSDDKLSELRVSMIGGLEIRDGSGNLVNPITLQNLGQNLPYEIYCEPGANSHSTQQAGSIFAIPLSLVGTVGTTSYVRSTVNPQPNITGAFQGAEEDGTIYLQSGWTARLNVRFQLQGHKFVGESASNPDLEVDRVRIYLQAGSSFRSQKIQTGFSSNATVEMNRFVNPNLKQKDILDDIVARYNCIIYTNPNNENDIVFDIRDDFYASGPTYIWTKKRENKNREQIQMIGELQSAEFLLTYKKATDPLNKSYSELTDGDIYGQHTFFFSNEFVKGQKKIETPFEPTPFIRQILNIPNINGLTANYSTAIVPAISVTEPKTGFRVLYARQGLFTGDVSVNQDGSEEVKFAVQSKDPVTGIDVFNQIIGYPYSGHYDEPINPNFSLNFGNPEVVLAEMPNSGSGTWTPTANTIFQTRWLNTMQQIARGQLLKDEFYLTPEDVALVRRNPNCKVFIENQYYYVNDILFEGNQNLTKLAQVELITVEGNVNVPVDTPEYEGSFNDSGVSPVTPPGDGETSSKDETSNAGNNYGGNNENTSVKGKGNNTGSGTKNVTITGNENTVDSKVSNATIENGDGNYIRADNVTIRNRDNITVETEGVTIDGNSIIIDSKIGTLFNKIDGGFNELRSKNARYKENKIEGGKNEVQNSFSDSVVNKIDSDNGINEKI